MSDPPDRFKDLEAPPTEAELSEAEALRAALDGSDGSHRQAELARAVALAWDPRDLSREEHAALVQRAISTAPTRTLRRALVVRLTLGTGALMALAASVLLVLWTDRSQGTRGLARMAGPALAVSRSTQDLFHTQFPATGEERARIDRIAMARASDLRDNEFAKWGVR
jgi:hypothetical protein